MPWHDESQTKWLPYLPLKQQFYAVYQQCVHNKCSHSHCKKHCPPVWKRLSPKDTLRFRMIHIMLGTTHPSLANINWKIESNNSMNVHNNSKMRSLQLTYLWNVHYIHITSDETIHKSSQNTLLHYRIKSASLFNITYIHSSNYQKLNFFIPTTVTWAKINNWQRLQWYIAEQCCIITPQNGHVWQTSIQKPSQLCQFDS